MDSIYNEELKKLVIAQYNNKKEEYEHSLAAAKDKIEDDGGIELRSGLPTYLRLASVSYDINCRKKHHTEKYEVGNGRNATPIYRRGDSFKMNLKFNRKYNPQSDSLFLIVSFGPNASINNGTKYTLPILPSKPNKTVNQWAVWIEEYSGNNLTLKIFTPASCLVGIWRFKYSVSSLQSKEDEIISAENIFYIIFNPWCEDDQVYMREEKDREAYVITDYGNIFQGTYKDPSAKQWVYGQFDFSVLPSVFLLIERSTYPANVRGSAAVMARALAAVINVNDDNGLLVGKWTGDFNDGTNPDEWIGSVGIFDRFLSGGGGQAVRYAQCWVFAGCLTTACRAIGIPCRTVTCFQAAHDGDGSLTISYYLGQNGEELNVVNSIWNYHVWNEVWIERNDLPEEYSGWQAIDATPQERSKDIFRVGPAPVKAVCNADLGLNYDIPFLFSEVNADLCYFQRDPTSSWGYRLIQRKTNEVGILIVTDSANNELYSEGQAFMEKLNDNYKYREGSGMERKMFHRAVNQMPTAQMLYERIGPVRKIKNDVNFTITKIKSVIFGEQFGISVTLQSYTSESRTVEVNFKANASLYTGRFVASIKEESTKVILQPKENKQVTVTVSADEYTNKLGIASHIKVAVIGTVQETEQLFTSDDTFEVMKPKLEIKVQDVVQLTAPFLVTFFFENPFPTELKNCTLTLEAGQVRRPTVMEISNVPVKGVMEKTIELMPKHIGRSIIIGVLNSDNQTPVRGSTFVDVQH